MKSYNKNCGVLFFLLLAGIMTGRPLFANCVQELAKAIVAQIPSSSSGPFSASSTVSQIEVKMAMPVEVLTAIPSKGILNQHESGKSQGSYAPSIRFNRELILSSLGHLDRTHTPPAALLPKYGFLDYTYRGEGSVRTLSKQEISKYGQIVLTFKPSLRTRVSYTLGDSLGGHNEAYSLQDLHPLELYNQNHLIEGGSYSYIEAQIWGELEVEDIAEIGVIADLTPAQKNIVDEFSRQYSIPVYELRDQQSEQVHFQVVKETREVSPLPQTQEIIHITKKESQFQFENKDFLLDLATDPLVSLPLKEAAHRCLQQLDSLVIPSTLFQRREDFIRFQNSAIPISQVIGLVRNRRIWNTEERRQQRLALVNEIVVHRSLSGNEYSDLLRPVIADGIRDRDLIPLSRQLAIKHNREFISLFCSSNNSMTAIESRATRRNLDPSLFSPLKSDILSHLSDSSYYLSLSIPCFLPLMDADDKKDYMSKIESILRHYRQKMNRETSDGMKDVYRSDILTVIQSFSSELHDANVRTYLTNVLLPLFFSTSPNIVQVFTLKEKFAKGLDFSEQIQQMIENFRGPTDYLHFVKDPYLSYRKNYPLELPIAMRIHEFISHTYHQYLNEHSGPQFCSQLTEQFPDLKLQ